LQVYDWGWSLSLIDIPLTEFNKSIVKYPNIERFPGGASNDMILNLQNPGPKLPIIGGTTARRPFCFTHGHEYDPEGALSAVDAGRIALAAKHLVIAETTKDPTICVRSTRTAEMLLSRIKPEEVLLPTLEELLAEWAIAPNAITSFCAKLPRNLAQKRLTKELFMPRRWDWPTKHFWRSL
jgi:hypothetical protein